MKLALTLVLLSTLSVCGRDSTVLPLEIGDSREGTLTEDDFNETYGVIADAIPVRYSGGQPVAVIATSDALDPFVIIASQGAPIGADAGQAGGQGACVVLDAPHKLDVQVYVSSAGAAPFGDYRISALPATEQTLAEHGCRAESSPTAPEPDSRTFAQASRPNPASDASDSLTDS